MTTETAAYISDNDKTNDYTSHLSKLAYNTALEDIDDLMHTPENRDIELWTELEVNLEDTVADFENVEEENRNLEWSTGLAAIAAASTLQFVLSRRDFSKAADYKVSLMSKHNLTSTQLVSAGKRLVTADDYDKVYTRINRTYPNLRGVSDTELYRELRSIGAIRPFDDHITDSVSYVTRMTDYPSGSPQFKAAVNDLIDSSSKRGVSSMNQRSVARLIMFSEAEGDVDTLMMWMLDASASHCDFCPPNAGVVQSLEAWLSQGLPGAATCEGGDRCKCLLVRADAREPNYDLIQDEVVFKVRNVDKGDGSFVKVYF